MQYFKIQTNRASIKNLLTVFESEIQVGEFLISPRPPLSENLRIYFALMCVHTDSPNRVYIEKFKNIKEITKVTFEEEKAKIKFYWSLGTYLSNTA